MNILRSSQGGDTIVEVIIAVSVVALLLTAAFVTTNRSTQTVRDAEEHTEALQLLQGQVELLRHAAANSGGVPSDSTLTSGFCLDASTSYAYTNPACMANGLYRLKIIEDTTAPGPTKAFDLTATWPSLAGPNDVVNLAYKVVVTP